MHYLRSVPARRFVHGNANAQTTRPAVQRATRDRIRVFDGGADRHRVEDHRFPPCQRETSQPLGRKLEVLPFPSSSPVAWARAPFSTTATRVSGSPPLCRWPLTMQVLCPTPFAYSAGMGVAPREDSGLGAWQAHCSRTHGGFHLSAQGRGVLSGHSGVGGNVPPCSTGAGGGTRREHSPQSVDGWPDWAGRRSGIAACVRSRCSPERLGSARRT